MESAKSYFRCWFGSDEKNDELNRLKGELEDARVNFTLIVYYYPICVLLINCC